MILLVDEARTRIAAECIVHGETFVIKSGAVGSQPGKRNEYDRVY